MPATSKIDLYFELLDLIDELLGFRNRLNNLLKSSFFELSTTKYQIGAENITSMQYDKRMKSNWALESLEDGFTAYLSKNGKKDPIEWFGLLTPQSLKNSQIGFYKAVEVMIEIANLNAQIKRVEDEILLTQS